MRKEFFEGSLYAAKKQCFWASKFTKVVGGYMCFESVSDYETWKKQK